tara:strand:+ start:258 stop:374 length:117 start_codon:yes stop_codon:yes gene_type:complete
MKLLFFSFITCLFATSLSAQQVSITFQVDMTEEGANPA